MSKIVLEVDDSVAAKWKASSHQLRKQVAELVGQLINGGQVGSTMNEVALGYARPARREIQKQFDKVQADLPDYTRFLNQIGDLATKNGLTQEILDELLATDE